MVSPDSTESKESSCELFYPINLKPNSVPAMFYVFLRCFYITSFTVFDIDL